MNMPGINHQIYSKPNNIYNDKFNSLRNFEGDGEDLHDITFQHSFLLY